MVATLVAGLTNSGAVLSWEASDFVKLADAGTSFAKNSFLSIDLLPYVILAGAVIFILHKVFGIFSFGGGKSKSKG